MVPRCAKMAKLAAWSRPNHEKQLVFYVCCFVVCCLLFHGFCGQLVVCCVSFVFVCCLMLFVFVCCLLVVGCWLFVVLLVKMLRAPLGARLSSPPGGESVSDL